MAYANGQIPLSALTALSTGGHLLAPAAAAFEQWRIEAAKAGFDMRPTTVGDAYRNLDRQISVFNQRYEMRASPYVGPYNDVRYWRGVRYVRMRGAAAAVPGTSNHGKGLAVDIKNAGPFGGAYHAWMSRTGPRLGFTNVEGRLVNEPWHWVHSGVWTVNNPIGGNGGIITNPTVPNLPDPLEDDLSYANDAPLRERFDQIVAWMDKRFNDLANHSNGNRNQLADHVTANAKTTRSAIASVQESVDDIASRVNWANRPDGTPYLIASQGDVDMILAAVRESQGGATAAPVQVDATALADALVRVVGPQLAAEVKDALTGLSISGKITKN